MAPSPAVLLRQARKAAGLNQRELAKRAKTAQSVVARIELGVTSPSWDTLSRLLRAAGTTLEPALSHTVGGRETVEASAPMVPIAAAPRRAAVSDVDLVLDDVDRTLALSADDRLRELRNVDRFLSAVKRA